MRMTRPSAFASCVVARSKTGFHFFHAVFNAVPHHTTPSSPSSRRFETPRLRHVEPCVERVAIFVVEIADADVEAEAKELGDRERLRGLPLFETFARSHASTFGRRGETCASRSSSEGAGIRPGRYAKQGPAARSRCYASGMRRLFFACLFLGACLPTHDAHEGDEAGLSDASLSGNDAGKLDVDFGDSFAILGTQPSHGPFTGGTRTLLWGAGSRRRFACGSAAREIDASEISASDPTRAAVTTPPGAPGPADVKVRTTAPRKSARYRKASITTRLRSRRSRARRRAAHASPSRAAARAGPLVPR